MQIFKAFSGFTVHWVLYGQFSSFRARKEIGIFFLGAFIEKDAELGVKYYSSF